MAEWARTTLLAFIQAHGAAAVFVAVLFKSIAVRRLGTRP